MSTTDAVTARDFAQLTPRRARHTRHLIYPIKSGQIKKRVVGKNLPQSLPDSDSDWQSVNEADCSRFRGTVIRQQQRMRWRTPLTASAIGIRLYLQPQTVAASLNRQGLVAKAAHKFKIYG